MGKSSNKESKEDNADLKALDQPQLQAVLLADSFLTTFQPLSLDIPKVLCPLNNVTLLNYAMDCLASNGVEQVFVVCTNDQVEEELQLLGMNGASNGSWQGRMTMECIKDTSLTNAGDALRELYKRNVIQSDPFLLLFGDVVTNMDLRQAILGHQQRHAQDSAAIMTLILKETGCSSSSSRIQSAKSDLVVGYDPSSTTTSTTSTEGSTTTTTSNSNSNSNSNNNRVLLYDNHSSADSVALPCSFFAAHPQMVVRTDLLDTGVCICSPDVLGRFEDEFDYLDIAHDFVHNCVAEEEEGLQTRIYAHILSGHEYAARVVDWATYHAVSHDLLRRWGYPLVADNTVHKTSTSTSTSTSNTGSNTITTANALPQLYKSANAAAASPTLSPNYYLYKESVQPSKVARSSTIQGPGLLGSRGQICEEATIRASVIGHGVTIGASANIEDSHLWDSVIIEANATIIESIVAQGAIIKQGAVISRGCLIGQGCVIGENVVLPEYTRITLQEEEDDPFGDDGADDWADEDDVGGGGGGGGGSNSSSNKNKQGDTPQGLETDTQVVGKDGKGRVWYPSLEEEEDSEDDDDDDGLAKEDDDGISNLHLQSIGTDLTGYYDKRLQRQVEPENDGFSQGGDDADEMMEAEAFARYTEDAFTFADTPALSSGSAVPLSSAAPMMVVGRQKGVDVVKELKEICMEFEDTGNTPVENLGIELNSYKFSQNASYSDCTMASILAMIEKLEITPDTTDGKLVSGFKHKLEFWAPLLQKMSIGQPEEIAIIQGLEQAATSTTKIGGGELTGVAQKLSSGLSFRFLLQTLHDEEVLSEEALLAWAETRKSEADDTPVGKLFRMTSVQDFLEWLEEEDDDEEESSEEEED